MKERINRVLEESNKGLRPETQCLWPCGRGEEAIEFGQSNGELPAEKR